MSNDAYDEAADTVGNLGAGLDDASVAEIEEAEANTDLMRAEEDPLPDAQVPGIGPDGQAPNTPV